MLVWGGSVVAGVAMAGLGVYFWRVGLDDADKLASVISVFVAMVGLGSAVYGLISDRSSKQPNTPETSPSQPRSGDKARSFSADDGVESNVNLRAEASGQGRIYQAGRDQTIHG
ncbi:hypothetical protein [Nonomuraea sp. NPDC049158]|uniref:hypothetical protein n=1 Tax=Nonomuraea sp. NPDC049158 TaxID=3155649 RepID=UPI0033DC4B22